MNPELSHYAFCTNGSYYAGKAGIPTIGFGSLESLAHVVDEYIEIDQLEKACLGYMGLSVLCWDKHIANLRKRKHRRAFCQRTSMLVISALS